MGSTLERIRTPPQSQRSVISATPNHWMSDVQIWINVAPLAAHIVAATKVWLWALEDVKQYARKIEQVVQPRFTTVYDSKQELRKDGFKFDSDMAQILLVNPEVRPLSGTKRIWPLLRHWWAHMGHKTCIIYRSHIDGSKEGPLSLDDIVKLPKSY